MGTLTVPERFSGPPGAANGGWISGTLASALAVPATWATPAAVVKLRAATPVETPVTVECDSGSARLVHEDTTLVTATPLADTPDYGRQVLRKHGLDDPPAFVPLEVAAATRTSYEGSYAHPYPGCFVCGPHRLPGDGLRLFTGPGPELAADTVAGIWRVDDSLADADGSVPAVFVWAALDCASYWAHRARSGKVFSALLVQIAAAVDGEVRVGGEYVVVARAEQVDGRKLWGSTAVYHPGGTLVGRSRALWIVPAPQ